MPRHTHVIFSAAILLALVVSSVLSVGPAYAATFTVNTTADSVDANPGNGVCADSGGACSLRAAIMEANALAGADVITLPVGTYLLTLPGADNTGAGGDLDITESLTITGAGSGSTTIQQTVSGERVIHIVLDVTVSISGVTITGGSGTTGQGGSGIYNNGTLTVNNSVITGNTTTYQGGGIYNNSGTLTITNSTISNNSAARRGGGILTTGSGALTVTNSVIESNTASGTNSFDGGGGIHHARHHRARQHLPQQPVQRRFARRWGHFCQRWNNRNHGQPV
ncbi:MAG: CSLREA domain-containing protein [Anaerolineales bacterium]